jgi:hypothetical protein
MPYESTANLLQIVPLTQQQRRWRRAPARSLAAALAAHQEPADS